jgi:hypothetical protein
MLSYLALNNLGKLFPRVPLISLKFFFAANQRGEKTLLFDPAREKFEKVGLMPWSRTSGGA